MKNSSPLSPVGAETVISDSPLSQHRSLFDHCPVALLVTEGSTHDVCYVNPAFLTLTGLQSTEILSRKAACCLPAEYRRSCEELLDRVFRTGGMAILGEQERPSEKGSSSFWSFTAWVAADSNDRPVGVVLQVADTTDAALLRREIERSNEQLKLINERLVISYMREQELVAAALASDMERLKAQNEQISNELISKMLEASALAERNRIGLELHDTLAQGFIGIKLQIDAAQDAFEETQQVSTGLRHLIRAREIALQSQLEARRAVEALRTTTHGSRTLAAALERLTDQTSVRIKVRMVVKGTPYPLLPAVEHDIFRIGQEALTNALRHSDPCTVTMKLQYDAKRLRLTVHDDGSGFDLSACEPGMGLAGMHERADRCQGKIDITSVPGKGTEVCLTLKSPHRLPAKQPRAI
jgi:PAS domain S-box-containing protein